MRKRESTREGTGEGMTTYFIQRGVLGFEARGLNIWMEQAQVRWCYGRELRRSRGWSNKVCIEEPIAMVDPNSEGASSVSSETSAWVKAN